MYECLYLIYVLILCHTQLIFFAFFLSFRFPFVFFLYEKNSRKCWLESSFVGARPLDSPQTPIIENTPLIAAVQAAAATAAATSSSSTSSVGLRAPLFNNNNITTNNNNNNNLQYINNHHQNIDGRSLNLSALTGNEIQLGRMNGGLNNGTSSSSAGGVNLGVGESKRKTLFKLQKIQEC